jgi:hypothetical protein
VLRPINLVSGSFSVTLRVALLPAAPPWDAAPRPALHAASTLVADAAWADIDATTLAVFLEAAR